MKYRTKNDEELNAMLEYLSKLVGQEAIVELRKHSPKRTNQQNRYMRVLFKSFSDQTGYELEETEYIFKVIVNPDLLSHEKNGIRFPSSSRNLSTAEMTTCIDRFHRYAAEAGFPLPLAHNEDDLINLENRMEPEDLYI